MSLQLPSPPAGDHPSAEFVALAIAVAFLFHQLARVPGMEPAITNAAAVCELALVGACSDSPIARDRLLFLARLIAADVSTAPSPASPPAANNDP